MVYIIYTLIYCILIYTIHCDLERLLEVKFLPTFRKVSPKVFIIKIVNLSAVELLFYGIEQETFSEKHLANSVVD